MKMLKLVYVLLLLPLLVSTAFGGNLPLGHKGPTDEVRAILERESQVVVASANVIDESASSFAWRAHFLSANKNGDWYFLKGDRPKGSKTSILEVVLKGKDFSATTNEKFPEDQMFIMSGISQESGKETKVEMVRIESGNFIVLNTSTNTVILLGKDVTITKFYDSFSE